MNIKRIIREELETSLGTLYLLVSDDEKFIYGMGKFGGESFEPIENFTPEAILNSAHKSKDGAYRMVDWAKYYKDNRTITGRNNSGELTRELTSVGKSANDILKHNPKVITVDFIIKKREEDFPIIESEEFDWIKDVDPDNVHIRDLEIGMKVIANCPPNKSLRTRELTVDSFFPKTKYSKHIKYRGQFCVHFKEFGKQVQPKWRGVGQRRVPVVTICEHLGCSFKLINKEINESDDMDWIQDVPDNLNGIKFTHIDEPSKVYTIRDTEISPRRNEYHSYITVFFHGHSNGQVRRKNAYSNFKNGRWIIYDEKINESDDMDWIRDVTPIESPTLDPDKWYVVWLDDITPEEREYVGEWLFKKFPQCKDLPMSDGWWNNKRVITLRMNPCSVGGYTIRQPIEEAREAYDTWSRRMTVIDPIKILRGVSINESDDMQWIDDVSGDLQIGDSIIDHKDKKWRIIEKYYIYGENNLVKVKRYGLKGVYDIFTKKNIDKVSKGLWKLIPNPNINESDDMQWIEDVSPSDLYVGVRFRLESPHPNLGRRTRGPIFTVTEVLGDEFTSIDTEGYVWVVNIDAWQEWKNENSLYILEPNRELMLKGSYKMGDDLVDTKKKGGVG